MKIMVKEEQYIYPPRASEAIPIKDAISLYSQFGWKAQLKYNDSRCQIKILPNGSIELWNRHAEKFRSYKVSSELQKQLQKLKSKLPEGLSILDGGLLDQKHKAIKNTIAIWDILVLSGEHLVGTTYKHRYDIVHDLCSEKDYTYGEICFGKRITDDIFVPENLDCSDWEDMWKDLNKLNEPFVNTGEAGPLIEGLVFKDLSGKLEFGFKEKNNSSWMTRSRVRTGRHAF